ncbi:MAG: hypothetical protein QM796_16010 [Chthoniobacteraceae bacterium]
MIHAKLWQWLHVQTGDVATSVRLLSELLALLDDADARDVLESLSAEERQTPFGLAALERWLDVDALAAARWVAVDPGATESQARVIAQRLVPVPVDLQRFCHQLPDTAWRQTFLVAAGIEALRQNSEAVIDLAQQMKPDAAQTNLLETAVNDWMGRDPVATQSWIMSVSDPALREQLIATGAKSYAIENPAQAAAWLASVLPPGEARDGAALNIVNLWSAQDPLQAAGWVTAFPDGTMKNAAIAAVLGPWLKVDPNAATAWAQGLPGGKGILTTVRQEQLPGATNVQ